MLIKPLSNLSDRFCITGAKSLSTKLSLNQVPNLYAAHESVSRDKVELMGELPGELERLRSVGWSFFDSKPSEHSHAVFVDNCGHFLIEGDILNIEFYSHVSQDEIAQYMKDHDLNLIRPLSRRRPRFKVKSTLLEPVSTVELSQALELDPEVKWCEAEFIEVIGHR